MANRNFANSRIYNGHVMPVQIDCTFTVDDTSGLGISGLTGAYVKNVFMHTATTPSGGNPNPEAGAIVVRLADNFEGLYAMDWDIVAPASGSDVKIDNSAMTAGAAYTITTLGNATAAKWHLIGVPAGITPAVGVSFIAASNGGAGNTLTSRVQISAATGSSVAAIELIGNPALLLAPAPSAAQGYGASFILQCRDYAGALVAPVAGSKITIKLLLSNSSVLINGS